MGLKPRVFAPPTFYLGDGIAVRPLRRADAAELYAVVDANRARLREWMPWVEKRSSAADIAGFINGSVEAHRRMTALRFAIAVGGEIAGVISLEAIDRTNRKASIGYWIDGECEGHGVVSRAVMALCDHGFSAMGLNRIEIHCGAGNWRSRKIPERLGFTNEGVLREVEWLDAHFVDHVLYAMLAADWKNVS
jgi:ribosomal-protein-serine acetyltransferase